MGKYNLLWDYVRKNGNATVSFDEAEKIAGVPMDHSFLQYKKELAGYRIKISLKEKSIRFEKTD